MKLIPVDSLQLLYIDIKIATKYIFLYEELIKGLLNWNLKT